MSHHYGSRRLCLLALFFLASYCSFSQIQNLKDKLQGDWLCTKIINPDGDAVRGEFGPSGEYLRFSFENKHVSISQAPFDKGLLLPVNFEGDSFDPVLEINWFLPPLKYTVQEINEDHLVLAGITLEGNPVLYYFINQKKYLHNEETKAVVHDLGFIIVDNSALSKSHVYGAKVNWVDYSIQNSEISLYPSPVFKDELSSSFSAYLTRVFLFPREHHSKTLSDELIVDFQITPKGLQNIRIVQGVTYEINAYVFKLLEESRNKWIPVIVNGRPITCKVRLHFLLTKEK